MWVLHRNDPLTAANWVARPTGASPRRRASQPTGSSSCRRPRSRAARFRPRRPGRRAENEKRFYAAVLATNVPFVWSFAVDSPMHRKVSPPGGFGALQDENWQPKPVVDLLASPL
jgi:hypothetical protein